MMLGLSLGSAAALGGCAGNEADATREVPKEAQAERTERQAGRSATTTRAPSPAPASPAAPAQEPIDALEPKRGPGAVLTFDSDAAPLVPADTLAVDYVTRYFERLIAQDYAAAWTMVPSEDPSQGVSGFLSLLAGYEPQGFFVTDVTDVPEGQTVTALQFGADNRSWTTTWEFIDTARGRVLKDVTYALPQGGACH